MTNDDSTVPQRTMFETQVSIFPALPAEQDLTAALYDTLTVYIRTAVETFLTSNGLESHLDVIVRRTDVFDESTATIVIDRKLGDQSDGS